MPIILSALLVLVALLPVPTMAAPGSAPSRAFTLRSPAFAHRAPIPARYTCDGEDVSPALRWSGAPAGTRSFALVVFDPDAPDPKAPKMTWIHWIVYNIPAQVRRLPRNAGRLNHPGGGDTGTNSWQRTRYGGPCPPIGTHRYFFRLYALNRRLQGLRHPQRRTLRGAMRGHVLARTRLIGLYHRR